MTQYPTGITFTGGFFLCGGRVRIVAPPDGVAAGLYFAGNQFIGDYCHFSGYSAFQADGAFTAVRDLSIVGTMAQPGIQARNSRATQSLTASTPTSTFLFNLTDLLLFDAASIPLRAISASLVTDTDTQQPVALVARSPQGGIVRVDAAAPVTGTVTVTVDQSA